MKMGYVARECDVVIFIKRLRKKGKSAVGDGSGRNRTHIVSSNRPETSYIRTRIREDPATDSQVEKELYHVE